MTIRAERDGRFYLRFLLIGIGLLGFSLYCLYDGSIAWPLQQEKAVAYDKFVLEEKNEQKWIDLANEKGWSTSFPGAPREHYEMDIKTQFWMAGGTAILAVFPLLAVLLSRGRWIELSGDTLTSSWGQTVKMDQITGLEKRQWRNKGIAKLRYEDNGKRRTFVIDDFKFKRAPTDQILAEIEKQISHDLITGGPPEGYEPPEAEAMAEAEAASDG
ncbi:MAG: hypothetical protein AB7G28_13730 [Pirellulales bacterium]